MITPGANRYEVVLNDRYFLGDLVEAIRLEDTIGEIAYRADIALQKTEDLKKIIGEDNEIEGWPIRVSGIPFGGASFAYLLHPANVWTTDEDEERIDRLTITAFDRSFYLLRSEDQYLLAKGTTAAQRLKRYCADWNVPVSPNCPDTKVSLEKGLYRGPGSTLGTMIMGDLKETARKGGELFVPRWEVGGGFTLFKIGSNKDVWVFERDVNYTAKSKHGSLESAVTQVKVLGKESKGKNKSSGETTAPVMAILKRDTQKYGTIQKVFEPDATASVAQAKKAAEAVLGGPSRTTTVRGIDINTIRAGDKVMLDDRYLIAAQVIHDLGDPGEIVMTLMGEAEVRRQIYAE